MLKSLSAKLGHVLVLYGGWGLFAMSFLDSSLIPFPVVNDLALIVMASKRPAWWPLYALASTLGSVCGRLSPLRNRPRWREVLLPQDYAAMP